MMSGLIKFPNPYLAGDCEILHIGGELSPDNLINAYKKGIFPWYSEYDPVLWWCPLVRHLLFTDNFRIPKSIRKNIRKKGYSITFNKHFNTVIKKCAEVKRNGQHETWITNDMIDAYIKLHKLGYAYSIEVWQNKGIVGGLYGLQIGNYACGESMFHETDNASDAALIKLLQTAEEKNIGFIDCQVTSDHIFRYGAAQVTREFFLNLLYRELS